jgi:Cephalosporin hydroxylase
MNLKDFARNILTPRMYAKLKVLYGRVSPYNLTVLARIHNTDKLCYTLHYKRHFESLRKKKLKILEIGVGGYEDPNAGGESLRMWKFYFPKSHIYGLDIYDKSGLEEHRIKIFRGSQNDPNILRGIVEQMEGLDIVIDDGSHTNEHVITAFKTLFPLLADGGIYVIEDTGTSYWPQYGGDSYDLNKPSTSMGFLKTLTDGLNYESIARKDYRPSYFDQSIISLHFYNNLIFIYKGKNKKQGSGYTHGHIY